jgi:hypothetical protein
MMTRFRDNLGGCAGFTKDNVTSGILQLFTDTLVAA